MQKIIFESKNKQKVLLALAESAGRFFSLKELSLKTNVSYKRLKVIISGLAKHKLLYTVDKNREHFYRLAQNTPLYQEISRQLAYELKPKGREKKRDFVEKVISSAGDVRLIALSGIFIGLENAPVDLLIVGSMPQARIDKAMQILEKLMGIELNYALFSEYEYRERLYSYDWFVKEIIERDPIILADKFSRDRPHGGKQEKYIKTVYARMNVPKR